MKKLLFEQKHSINNEAANIKSEARVLNKLNDFWKLNKLGELSLDMVQSFISNPVEVIYKIYYDRIPDTDPHTQLRMNKDKVLEGLELPRFDTSILYLIEIIDRKNHLPFFDFGGDEVTVNEERLNKYLDGKYRYYSEDPDVLEVYSELNELAEQLNWLNKKISITALNLQTFGASDKFFAKIAELFRISEKGIYLTQQGFQDLQIRKKNPVEV